jgi:UDP-N-acetylmuramate dehydrogenase
VTERGEVDGNAFEAAVTGQLGVACVRANAPLAPLTTFKVGGPADWLIDVRTVDELGAVLAAAREFGVPTTLLGGGSNVLIGDRGIRGAVVRMRLMVVMESEPGRVRAEAGVTINGLVRWTVGRGWRALEAWAGTPGTVGGAVYGNAHYAGRNIGDLICDVGLMSRDGIPGTVPRDLMEFGYDSSRLQRTREILIWAEFAVVRGAPGLLRQTARESLAYRKRTQPLEAPSAGCIFQNPNPARDRVPSGMPASAGALVDRAGLKNHRIGGARISPTHANFVVNDGHATAQDIQTLIETARDAVRDRFGVELRDEVVRLGEF